MTHEQEIAEKLRDMADALEFAPDALRRLAFKLKNPPLMSVACHKEIVAVAIAVHMFCRVPAALHDDDLIGVIMNALGGKANPNTLRDEIRRQRGAV